MANKQDDTCDEYVGLANENRAMHAAEALGAYPPTQLDNESGPPLEELIVGLLGDLLHLARREEIDPLRAVERAVEHFVAESAEEKVLVLRDLGPWAGVVLVAIKDGDNHHELGKRGRRRARRERSRRMEVEAEMDDEGKGSLH